jgi:2-polyprenyl-6-methoxyphenol hydroxylase-like FAD-dependent oxidoreductase
MLGQQHHEKILRSHLEKLGTVVEFGSELKGFEQFEDHVTVQIVRRSHGEESLEETEVPWVIGTDGARSIVRKTLALSFLGETREANEMVVGDIKVKAGLDHDVREIVNLSFRLILFLCSFGKDGSSPQTCKV